jgi:hypothetical protein
MNMRDYPTLHLDANKCEGTAHPYPVLLQAVPLHLFERQF